MFNKSKLPENPNEGIIFNPSKLKTIWFAGGCFWGVEAFFQRIYGVAETSVGYANGRIQNPTYHEISHTGHVETVEIKYDPQRVSLEHLLKALFSIIDPTSLNRQGNDVGTQYRTGIYYHDESDRLIIDSFIQSQQELYLKPIVVEVKSLDHYYIAEDYHQKYLDNNPGGYCHVDFSVLSENQPNIVEAEEYDKIEDQVLRETLDQVQYQVTRENATEPPFQNQYWNHYQKGIYVDITSGEPLFVSSDKFESGCGWPSFSRPIDEAVIIEKKDTSHGMQRVEVRSRVGDAHLGHVFTDGPEDKGGLRYCINSAALRFIPYENMGQEGYGKYKDFVK